jgi:AcrR family transcriptional regulator
MQMLPQAAGVPDPFLPMGVTLIGPAGGGSHPSFERKRQRRAEILARTRQVLADDGAEAFTIRSIAQVCGISAQTLHNVFGSRAELLSSALNEHTDAMDALAHSADATPFLFVILAAKYCDCASLTPNFLREFTMLSFVRKLPMLERLISYGVHNKTAILREMSRRGYLRNFIDPQVLASQIARINTYSVYEWAAGHSSIAEVRGNMLMGNVLTLLGAIAPAHSDLFESQCAEFWSSGAASSPLPPGRAPMSSVSSRLC